MSQNPSVSTEQDSSTAGVTRIEGLADLNAQSGDTPRIERLAAGPGATVVRLSFAAGQTMEEHRAGFPILVSGAAGHVTFEVGGQSIELVPGTAVHVEAGIMHRLVANADSVVTLVVLR